MKSTWWSITGLSLTVLAGACGTDLGPASPTSVAGATGTGTAGGPGTGTAGGPGTGTAGGPGAGTAGGPGAGTAGSPGTGTAGATGTGTAGGTGAGTAGGSATGTAGSSGTGSAGAAGAAGSGSPSDPLPRLVTSAPTAYWKTDGQLTEVTTGTADVTVNATEAQTWEGFGGAFNELGWKYLMTLSQAERDTALQLLFGNNGARFNMGRIPMGASDYAIARYTLNETANDTEMASFSLSQDMMYLIPYVKAAIAVKPTIHLWASPWTPPTWMKSGPFKAGNVASNFDGGTMKGDDATLNAHAKYFVKFVQQYSAAGLKIEAVAPQNEPNFEQNYPSCVWATATFVKFVGQFLGPQMMAASPETKIMLGTMSNGDKDPAILSAVLADATAKSFVKMIGMQWGMLGKESGAKASGLPMWQTEHKCGNYPWNPSGSPAYKTTAPNDQAYGEESWGLIRDWIKAGVSSYSAWNMVLDPVGKGNDTTRDWAQNALLLVNGAKIVQTPTYYVFRHLSQYVEPGAKVVGTTGGDALAFKNPDGKVVIVMFNSGAAKTAIVSAGGKMFSFALPAKGWATVTSQ